MTQQIKFLCSCLSVKYGDKFIYMPKPGLEKHDSRFTCSIIIIYMISACGGGLDKALGKVIKYVIWMGSLLDWISGD